MTAGCAVRSLCWGELLMGGMHNQITLQAPSLLHAHMWLQQCAPDSGRARQGARDAPRVLAV